MRLPSWRATATRRRSRSSSAGGAPRRWSTSTRSSMAARRPASTRAACMLVKADATVTVCHSKTPDLAVHTRQADIVVVAAGRPGLVTGDMLKPGAVVVDVGINAVDGHPGGG